MAFDRAPLAAGQHTEPLVQPLRELRRAQHRDPRRGQLQRQRDPIEAPHHLRDRTRIRVGHREVRLHRHRPVDEQANRLAARHRVPITGTRQRQRRDHQELLAGDAQALAARRKHHQPRAPCFQRPHQVDDRAEQVLAVVEHHQQLLRSARNSASVSTRSTSGRGVTPNTRRDRVDNDVRVTNPGQLHQPRTVTKIGQHLARDLQRQAGLAHPAHPGEGHHPRSPQCFGDPRRARRSRPTNELACNGRFPGNASNVRNGPNSRSRSGCDHLEQPLGSAQVTQPVLPEVDDPAVLGHRVVEELFGRERHDDLAAVRHRHQPRGAVHRGAVVVAVASLGLAGMDPHPDPQRLRAVPFAGAGAPVVRPPPPRPRRARSRTPRGTRRPSS